VAELWWAPHHMVQPFTYPGNDQRFVDFYIYTDPIGRQSRVPVEDMLHLKYGLDPYDQRLGLSPLASAARPVNSLQQAGNYRPNILRNFGTIGKFVRPKTEMVNTSFKPKEFKEFIDDQTRGDNVGGTVVADFPFDIDFPKVS